MGEKINRKRDKRKILISLSVGIALLIVLVVVWVYLNRIITSGLLSGPDLNLYGSGRNISIVLFAIDCFLILQWFFLLFFRSERFINSLFFIANKWDTEKS